MNDVQINHSSTLKIDKNLVPVDLRLHGYLSNLAKVHKKIMIYTQQLMYKPYFIFENKNSIVWAVFYYYFLAFVLKVDHHKSEEEKKINFGFQVTFFGSK